MLIEFSVKNFRSIKDVQTLSMAANPKTEYQETNTFDSGVKSLPRLLRSSIMYGPNASGKSNIILALNFMQFFVLHSQAQQQGQPIPTSPFMLNTETRNEPSEFEVHFVQNGTRYQYGFRANTTQVMAEWLVAYPNNRPQRWFERSFNVETNEEEWEFSNLFLGGSRRQFWRDTTRSNALFLSTAIQLNNEQLRPVFDWFQQKLAIILPSSLINQDISIKLCSDDAGCDQMMQFMNTADINIAGVEVRKAPFKAEILPLDMPEILREKIISDMKDKEMANIRFHHLADNGEIVAFGLEEESHGTQKIFWMAGPILDVLAKGRILVVDELDTNLHPLLLEYLVKLMHNNSLNKNNAQLIFATHNTTILDCPDIRRDQFWFVEKQIDNSTKLYPLTDFSPRKKEARERGYLKGRYGALPIIRGGLLYAE